MYKNIDMTGVKKASVVAHGDPKQFNGGTAEIHLDKPDGPLVGSVKITSPGVTTVTTPVEATSGHHDLYIVFRNPEVKDKPMFNFVGLRLENR
jgi:cytochrome c